MDTAMPNWEIIKRCEDFLTCTQSEKWEVNGQAPKKIGDDLLHVARLVLQDMKLLAHMEDAGLGHGAGPQVRRLLEISTVVSDLQHHDDVAIADAIFFAWCGARSLNQEQVARSKRRFKGEHGRIARKIDQCWGEYNSESHFNPGTRVDPAGGPAQVRHGIAMGYFVFNAMALFREEHLSDENMTESTILAEALLEEAGLTLLAEPRSDDANENHHLAQ